MTRLFTLAVSVLFVGAAQAAEPSLDSLGWLAGCWDYQGKPAGSGEVWTAPAGGTMFGLARFVRDGRTVAHEFLRIRVNGKGRIEYHADPSGQTPTAFAAVEMNASRGVFENPAHDYPQRIIYARDGERGLLAAIEGVEEGVFKRVEFPMTRARCPGP